jgi:hypothetical protein
MAESTECDFRKNREVPVWDLAGAPHLESMNRIIQLLVLANLASYKLTGMRKSNSGLNCSALAAHLTIAFSSPKFLTTWGSHPAASQLELQTRLYTWRDLDNRQTT